MALIDSLVSYWKLDESSGNAVDAHGSNTLTETNGPIASVSGKVGSARDLEASSLQYFKIASNSSLQAGDTDFTIAAWVNGESFVNAPVIAMKGWVATPDSGAEFILYLATSVNRFRLYVVAAGSLALEFVQADNFGAPATGTWYHVVCWHDSVNNLLGISINAGSPNTKSWTNGVRAGTRDFVVGASPSQSFYWDGIIDDIGFWRRVLTSDERSQLYNSGNGLAYPFATGIARRKINHSLINRGLINGSLISQ